MATRSVLRDSLSYALARTDATNARLDGWLNDALLDLCTQRIHVKALEGVGVTVAQNIGGYIYSKPAQAFSIDAIADLATGIKLTRIPGGFEEWLDARLANPPNDTASRFIERGNFFLVMPAPAATGSWTVYTYDRPTWGADDGDVPNIEEEWHQGIVLLAKVHAYRDLKDVTAEAEAVQEFSAWLTPRDSVQRRTNRMSRPQRGVNPASATRRNVKTGV